MVFLTTWSLDSLVLCQVSRPWPYVVHNGRFSDMSSMVLLLFYFFVVKSNIFSLLLVCYALQRSILPGNPFVFTHPRHLKLELILRGKKKTCPRLWLSLGGCSFHRKTGTASKFICNFQKTYVTYEHLLVEDFICNLHSTCWEIVNARDMLWFAYFIWFWV
jgi:hypothetical protein